MNKHIEHLLLSVLVSISVLLGLTFWLNTRYGFNLFSSSHWTELASMQASNQPINIGFYISVCVALFIFLSCLYMINRPRTIKQPHPNTQIVPIKNQPVVPASQTAVKKTAPAPTPNKTTPPTISKDISKETYLKPFQQPKQNPTNDLKLSRPPQLNLPKNMEQIAANQYAQTKHTQPMNQQNLTPMTNERYNKEIAEIFSNCAYLVKPNPTIMGLKTNLFAIGNKEVLWLGCVDCDINKLKTAIERLKATFNETLKDITITVYSFLLDTGNRYKSEPGIFIFHKIEELKKFIFENQGLDIPPSDQEDFDAYSEYIDTIITLLYNG